MLVSEMCPRGVPSRRRFGRRPAGRVDHAGSIGKPRINQSRWFDPSVGRWLSEDPSGLSAGPNPYEYCGNGPTDGTDPSGLYASQGHFWTVYIVAIATTKFNKQQAFELAYYAQYPDQEAEYEPSFRTFGFHFLRIWRAAFFKATTVRAGSYFTCLSTL